MNKETSSRVSTIAARIMQSNTRATADASDYNSLLQDARTLAASALSQDETQGQSEPKGDFLTRLKDERDDLDRRLIALNSYLSHNPGHPNPRHASMLTEQSKLMSDLLAVLDERICDIDISRRSAPPPEEPEYMGTNQ